MVLIVSEPCKRVSKISVNKCSLLSFENWRRTVSFLVKYFLKFHLVSNILLRPLGKRCFLLSKRWMYGEERYNYFFLQTFSSISFIFARLVRNMYPVHFLRPHGARISSPYFSCHFTTASKSAFEYMPSIGRPAFS